MAAFSGDELTMQISYAGKTTAMKLPAISVSDFYTKAVTKSVNLEVNATSTNKQEVSLVFKGSSSSSLAYLNYVEMNVPCDLNMIGKEMAITNTRFLGQNSLIRYKGLQPKHRFGV